jgi:hypothetical protein
VIDLGHEREPVHESERIAVQAAGDCRFAEQMVGDVVDNERPEGGSERDGGARDKVRGLAQSGWLVAERFAPPDHPGTQHAPSCAENS